MAKVYIVPSGVLTQVDENTCQITVQAQAGVAGATPIGFPVNVDYGDGANAINTKIVNETVAQYALLGVTIGPTDKKIIMGAATVL